MIMQLKREKPHWGARKIRELLVRRLGGDVLVPTKSTVHAVRPKTAISRPALQRDRSLRLDPGSRWTAAMRDLPFFAWSAPSTAP
jgi:hypothetical protein